VDKELKPIDDPDRKKMSIASFRRMKTEARRIVMVTSYDYPTAAIADLVGVDSVLVGDSYGMVVLGYETTIPVTIEELLPVCRAVRRGASRPLLIADMPFMSFQVSPEEAVRTAGRFVKEGGMEAVKIEGGIEVSKTVESISRIGIPVLGHIGVTPQTATLRGGYRIRGRNADSSNKLVEDAKSLEEAGAFGIVLEMVTEEVAKVITETVSVPTIGIGSGRFCDGQVLVIHDMIGLYPSFTPKFAKRYVDVAGMIRQALQNFTVEVRNGVFPEERHVFRMEEEQRARLDSRRNI
jgi:3-methyl-2-oxobutanoate hydroxymethyltransferase